jgi:hypothetical protein
MFELFHALPLYAVLSSWEDCERNRYFPIGKSSVLVRDGGTGVWIGIIELKEAENEPLANTVAYLRRRP